MKKIIKSIIAFVIASTIIFSGTAPITAMTLESINTQNASKAITTATTSDVPISERYHIIENGYRGKYDLLEGIFGHQSSQQVNKNAVYFYSDGYFADAPDIYNPSLSTMSLALSISAFNAMHTDFDLTMPNGSYSNLFRHAKVLMSDIGIKEKDIFVNDSFEIRPTEETIGMIMGAKEISLDDGNYILIPIAVRGGDYEAEWSSNVTLGTEGEAYGFSSSATKVIKQIENYINSNTSFDISSALNEGRVKFWIVGYSRGGAVANITAKRLTDVYGEIGNSVYSYCFEAPSGGVDTAEINESWTHNGIYANIHNIINSNDLVPKIPPKQMGFKRYGVDHYVPGTDAGEITTSIYETPTGITVTTHADNVPLIVGNNDYNERRAQMLYYLAAIDSNIVFSDKFSLVKIDFFSAIFNGQLFEQLEEGEGITSSQWLEIFINDLLNRAANGTYSNGEQSNAGYDKDYRDFYTSNSEFAGEKYVTLEVALQYILKLVFTFYYDDAFTDAIIYRAFALLLEYFTLIDFYFNVIQKWDELSEERQVKYLDKIWDCLDGDLNLSDGTSINKITDFVDPDEYDLLKNSVYTLSAFLFLFICKDYKTSPTFDGVNETQVHIVTLIANIITILQGHYPEICLAWLSTYDDNYSPENEDSKYSGTAINLINDDNNMPPEIELKIDILDKETLVSLSSIIKSSNGVDANSKENGSAIYYAVFENGNMVDFWQLYRTPIVIDTTNDTKYTVKAFATRFEEKSAELAISDEQLRSPTKAPEKIEDDNLNEKPEEPPSSSNNIVTYVVTISSAVLVLVIAGLLISKKKKK